MIPPPAQRAMAERTGAAVTEVPASHSVYVSQPQAVASLIKQAAGNTRLPSRPGGVPAPSAPGPHHQTGKEFSRTKDLEVTGRILFSSGTGSALSSVACSPPRGGGPDYAR